VGKKHAHARSYSNPRRPDWFSNEWVEEPRLRAGAAAVAGAQGQASDRAPRRGQHAYCASPPSRHHTYTLADCGRSCVRRIALK
jgi:hypothetical protein